MNIDHAGRLEQIDCRKAKRENVNAATDFHGFPRINLISESRFADAAAPDGPHAGLDSRRGAGLGLFAGQAVEDEKLRAPQ